MKTTMTHTRNAGRRFIRLTRSKLFLGAPVLCMVLLAGCATTGSNNQPQIQLESLFKEADTELSNGQREKAIALLNQAVKEYPTSMVPWLKMANIWFNAGNYPLAILAANEVLQRDASNQEAKSLLVVSGLRVAASSVSGLRSSKGVNSSVRVEAENLTNSLRTVLGEKVLVPAPVAADARPAARSAHSKSKRGSIAVSHTTPPPAQADASTGSADPFKALK